MAPEANGSSFGHRLGRRSLLQTLGFAGASAFGAPLVSAGTASADTNAASAVTKPATSTVTPVPITIDWNAVSRVSKTTATLQVVVNPLIRRDSPIHDNVFAGLKALQAGYVRFVPWYPYPRLGVAELEAPGKGTASWDFSLIDPMVEDFLNATDGHTRILNFSTTPEWMWRTPSPVVVPPDPDTVDFSYSAGTELAVPVSTVADYYGRLVAWYTAGGFVDEAGHVHRSGHHYLFEYWEVLNEMEHSLSPQLYTKLYDAITMAIQSVSPKTRFVGLALEQGSDPDYFSYFLNPANHRPGAPLDMISYHFYASPSSDDTTDLYGYDCFAQADGFISDVGYIERIRQQLSPGTRTTVDETGTILPSAATQTDPAPVPNAYWNFSGAIYAYVFAHLALMGIDIVGESQLVGYPSQFPSVSMVDWNTGLPNARYRVLQLILKHIQPGSALISLSSSSNLFYGLGVTTGNGTRKLLLISKRNYQVPVQLTGLTGATVEIVDQVSAGGPARTEVLAQDQYVLPSYGVAVATLKS